LPQVRERGLNPANLLSEPSAIVDVDGERIPVRARLCAGADREKTWALLAEVWLQESRIAARVIERLQPRIDVLFEHRLREALAPMVARIYSAVADEARKELAHRLREAVEQAINEELGRHRDT